MRGHNPDFFSSHCKLYCILFITDIVPLDGIICSSLQPQQTGVFNTDEIFPSMESPVFATTRMRVDFSFKALLGKVMSLIVYGIGTWDDGMRCHRLYIMVLLVIFRGISVHYRLFVTNDFTINPATRHIVLTIYVI
ncbi:hypothetical protein NPIL_431151 [Nephila pilipes]|uniref:Uncharacterized protein n=1 Tax=Nephila pilipes TaxID=299642 RepID=A0A8X6MLY2_NEPPI|nr:hypothetical protein NPIL_431151 [Nephila pilipes]